jgi:ABC-type nickel/cobalt efflux system permease component RcnA
MVEQQRGPHRAGQWFGGLVFAIGLAMMVAVFVFAVMAFLQVPAALAAGGRIGGEDGLGRALAVAAVRIGLLFVMAYVSSLFASKGLELFAAARAGTRE